MHHRSARHRDIDAALDPAVGADDEMANVFPGRRVDGRVEFSGLRIEVGMLVMLVDRVESIVTPSCKMG